VSEDGEDLTKAGKFLQVGGGGGGVRGKEGGGGKKMNPPISEMETGLGPAGRS